MKNILEMGSVYIATIQNFTKIGSGVQTLIRGICIQMQTARLSHEPTVTP
jgi:hypothetical protein